MASRRESPLFLKSYETLVWLLNHTGKFPKHQRFVMAKRMEEAALGFHDALLAAGRHRDDRRKRSSLAIADIELERLKVYNRLAKDLKLESFEQHTYLAEHLDELGRLLGGWMRSLPSSRPTSEGRGRVRG